MEDRIYKRIYTIFKRNDGYAQTRDITRAGIHNIHLNTLLEAGEIERIKRGLYRWANMDETGHSTLVDVAKAIPNGVICLQYALAHYNLTTYKPWEISVAVSHKSRVTIPDYPPVKLYYFSPRLFAAGIEKIRIGKHSIPIYAKEKTICDCMRYRKHLGKDIIKEMMVEYLRSSTRNLGLLMKYAEICGVTKQIQTYVEVLS